MYFSLSVSVTRLSLSHSLDGDQTDVIERAYVSIGNEPSRTVFGEHIYYADCSGGKARRQRWRLEGEWEVKWEWKVEGNEEERN